MRPRAGWHSQRAMVCGSLGLVTVTVLPTMRASLRQLSTDADWWAVRALIVATQAIAPPGWNWEIRRWDGSRFHRETPEQSRVLQGGVGLWEVDGRLVAAIHSEDGGDAHLQLHPDCRWLQPQMLDWAEAHLARGVDGRTMLRVYANDYDLDRRALLFERGYTMTDEGGWTRWLRFGAWQTPKARIGAPYRLATTSNASAPADASRMAHLLNASFGRTQHTAAEYLAFMTGSPSFSHGLNLVAVAPDGSFAAHVGVTYDATNRLGIFEPVCTHPLHLRHGLASNLMFEGMRRLLELGARSACVDTGDMEPANALYRACGFTEEYRGHWFELAR